MAEAYDGALGVTVRHFTPARVNSPQSQKMPPAAAASATGAGCAAL